jgi:hypothetical protein
MGATASSREAGEDPVIPLSRKCQSDFGLLSNYISAYVFIINLIKQTMLENFVDYSNRYEVGQ